jgi:hypothetical protein
MQRPFFLVLAMLHASPLMQVTEVVIGSQHPGSWNCDSCRSIVALWPLKNDRDLEFTSGTNRFSGKNTRFLISFASFGASL